MKNPLFFEKVHYQITDNPQQQARHAARVMCRTMCQSVGVDDSDPNNVYLVNEKGQYFFRYTNCAANDYQI